MKEARRVAAYLRVSADPSQGGRSIGTQRIEARRTAKELGVELLPRDEFEDTESASVFAKRRGKSRTNWAKLLDAIKTETYEYVILAELSRSTREMGAFTELAEACAGTSTRLVVRGRTVDLADTTDYFSAGLEVLLGDQESRRISERAKRGVRGSIADGRAPVGKAPFGYLRRPRAPGERVTQEIHPEYGPLVTEAARDVLDGKSLNEVARTWNAASGMKWTGGAVRRTLANPALMAKRVHRGKVVGDGNWAPLVDPATHYALVALFADPDRLVHHGPAPTRLLSSIATCRECGGNVRWAARRGGLYTCGRGCVGRSSEWLDALAADTTVTWLAATFRDQLVSDLGSSGAAEYSDEAREAAASRLNEAKRMRDEAADGAATSGLSVREALRVIASYSAQVEEAEAALLEIAGAEKADEEWTEWSDTVAGIAEALVERIPSLREGDPIKATVEAQFAGELVEMAAERWAGADLDQQRTWVRRGVRVELPKLGPKNAGKARQPSTIVVEPVNGWKWAEPFKPWWREPGVAGEIGGFEVEIPDWTVGPSLREA